MILIKERVGKLIEQVGELIYTKRRTVGGYLLKQEDGSWKELSPNGIWGGNREHFYFWTEISLPDDFAGKTVVYELRTGKEGEWDAINPQFLIIVNGEIRQGLDVNHRTVLLTEKASSGDRFEILLQAYTGDNNNKKITKTFFNITR